MQTYLHSIAVLIQLSSKESCLEISDAGDEVQVANPSPVAFSAPEPTSEPSTPPFVTPAKGRKGT